jgi:hypothetical protein
MSLATVLRALDPHGVKKAGAGWLARCPAHEDRRPSLTIGQGEDGRVLLCCQAGCAIEDVVASLEIGMSDLFAEGSQSSGKPQVVAEYNYRDEAQSLLYQVVRLEPKDFRQRRPSPTGGWDWKIGDVRKVLYRLPELASAQADETVFVVEGEKDADRLGRLGLVATTNAGGAGKWRREYSESLRGRHVAILPDNDEPGAAHATQVAKALEGIAAEVKVIKLAGLPPKGDVSDWLAAGGTAEKLIALASRPSIDATASFQPSPGRVRGERRERIQLGSQALSFGVSFLDQATGGIIANDVILVGAKTGIGKTALATSIALHNCRQGKRVHYFALEAENREIERRMKFQIIAAEYYGSRVHHPPIRYLDWRMGRLDGLLDTYEDWAEEQLAQATRTLHTYYRINSFTSDDFSRQLEEIKDETDLVVLDHVHYVDTDDDANENRAQKRLVKQIRDSALEAGKPMLVVAHVRKGERARFEPLVPSLDDFHGSSDIPKIATKAVMLAAAYDAPNKQPYLWNTYMQVLKCRLDMSVSRYVAMVVFDNRRNLYEENYVLGRLVDQGRAFSELPQDERPVWAAPSPQAEN